MPLGPGDLLAWDSFYLATFWMLNTGAWAFLGAHLCWSTGFMFLISWRGYWQELIDIILYMHLKTPIL